ncbi:hypothetical protein F4780DRAFT_778376 [Xylariomycetidae sp. FL0641]|nr:hypothetical protein F4780DRAFT_778376 [Xylariomycetidae sp. FL0641]
MSDGESDDGKRLSKKRKASRACDRCNSQHQPCDNAVPKCSVCVRAGTECTYNRPVRKRGPRSGYTGQNGERLWAIVLQAKPELEDIVLQVLRGGTYGNTGQSNLDFLRNNDNQTELVAQFNESRLGRFLQNPDAPGLNLPPVERELPPVTSYGYGNGGVPLPAPPDGIGSVGSVQTAAGRQDRSVSGMSATHASIVHPHGAPQNPGDIYLQSEDVRKHIFHTPSNQSYGYETNLSQGMAIGASINRSPSAMTVPHSTGHGTNGSTSEYGENRQYPGNHLMPEGQTGFMPSNGISSHQFQPSNFGNPAPAEHNAYHFGFADTTRWLDSIPTDTLLNLGFMPGEGMAEDFLELCENPDPIDSTPGFSVDQNEDEEAVWRRLVMRGRF